MILFPILLSIGHVATRPQRQRRDTVIVEGTTTTPATFQVERLDAPMERIEIRLIDEQEHENNTGVNYHDFVGVSASDSTHPDDADADNQITMDGDYNKYKKVEYVSDLTGPQQSTPAALIVNVDGQPESQGSEMHAKAWISSGNKEEFVDDVIQLPPDVEEDENPDDEGEPVEECLENRDQLPDDVVERLQSMKHKLSKMIRRLNKQQQQYCTEHSDYDAAPTHVAPEYRQCPNWREEKMVHYYKLMRIMYCQDMSRWPNASRVKRQFEPKLHLFETMYAFQKSESA